MSRTKNLSIYLGIVGFAIESRNISQYDGYGGFSSASLDYQSTKKCMCETPIAGQKNENPYSTPQWRRCFSGFL